MDRPLFGEFLVETGLASVGDVLSSLIEQVQAQMSVAQLVYQEKLLSEKEQLNILRVQSNTGWDYQQAATSLSLWNANLAAKVLEANAKARIPLGQILVTRGVISFSDLTKSLDDYVGLYEAVATQKESQTPPNVPIVSAMVTSPTVKVNSEKVAAENQPQKSLSQSESPNERGYQFPVIEPSLVAEFLEVLTESRSSEIAQIVASWSAKISSGDLDQWTLEAKAITRELESIVAAARFVRAETTLDLASKGAKVLEVGLSSGSKIAAIIGALVDAIKGVYEGMALLRRFVSAERCEISAWATDNGRILLNGAFAKCEMLLTND
jgi:hypothetical protein